MILVENKDGVLSATGFSPDVDIDKIQIPDGSFLIPAGDLPNKPISTWYIEDGVVKINQQKLIEFNRKNMSTLTPIEFDIKLVDAGLYDRVQDLIQSDIKLKIAYTRATFFKRTDPFIDQARIALNLTDEQVDAMWQETQNN